MRPVFIAGLTISAAILGGLTVFVIISGGDTEDTEANLCQELKVWHPLMSEYLDFMNEPQSRNERLELAYSRFFKAADLSLSPSETGDGELLRETVLESILVQESWMSALGTLDALTGADGTTAAAARLEAYQDSEKYRVAGNDNLRRLNGLLASACGIDPLPIYSE